MLVRTLHAHHLRNLEAVRLEASPRFNVLSGDNGQGKTNLLEALFLVGTLRSFRTSQASELVAFGSEEASARAEVERGGIERTYEVRLRPGRRTVRLDGKTPRSLREYFGGFNVVLFAPEDLRVPRGSPGERRRFLDRSVFNLDSSFLPLAQDYAKVLKTRNRVLRDGPANERVLSVFDEQLAELGERIVRARQAFLGELGPRFADAFQAITRTGRTAELVYLGGKEPLLPALRTALRRDLARRQTTVGPHVEDVEFRLDGRPARALASQGQLRALVLAWKTAEMRLLGAAHGDPPVLLLDDVSSELDPERTRYLFDFLDEIECQCFVTTTHPRHVLLGGNRKDFRVVAGTVSPLV